MFNIPTLVLIGAVIAYIKFLRSGYIKQLGGVQRFIVLLVGAGLFGAGMAELDLFGDAGIWICGGIGGIAFLLAEPWLLQPINDAHKEKDEQVNAALRRTDEPFASKREAILKRAETNNYTSDGQLKRDVEHLSIMLGDEKAAIFLINNRLKQSFIYKEDDPIDVKPVRKDAIRRK